MTLWENIAVSCFTALIAGPIGAWLALRRFRAEKWWEKKAAAYEKILSALHHELEECDQLLEHEIEHREMNDETRKQLAETSKAARALIKEQTRVGSFLLSERAEKRLKQLEKELSDASKENTYFSHVDSCWGAFDRALKDMKSIARDDLKPTFPLFSGDQSE